MKKGIVHFLAVLLWPVLALLLILGIVKDVGLDPHLYLEEQLKAGVIETAGISEEDLWKLDERLFLCLIGEDNWNEERGLQNEAEPLSVVVNGVRQAAFNAREVQHLMDCRQLFRLLSTVRYALLISLIFLTVLTQVLPRIWKVEDGLSLKHVWIGSAVIVAPFAVLAIWAAIDFSSAFTFFHKILFTNDLWLLDPRTDLLINICPSSMFANMGLRIALKSFAVLLGFPLLATLLKLVFDKRRKNSPSEA